MDNVRFGGSLSVPYYTQEPQEAPAVPFIDTVTVDVPIADQAEEKKPLPNALRELEDAAPQEVEVSEEPVAEVVVEENVVETQDGEDHHDVADEHRPMKKKRR